MRGASLTNSSANGTAPIAFLDSGVGGLPYLKWTRGLLPAENYIYLADRKHFPYGPKQPEEIFQAVAECVSVFLKKFDPKLFVLACNTASVFALEKLRAEFPRKTFVGTVPAIKPAAEASRVKKIGVLATAGTLHAAYLDNLIERFAPGCAVVRLPGPDIVNFVEKRLFTAQPGEKRLIIAEAAARFREEAVDTVVLACTHFLYLLDEIHSALGEGVRLIDSREGVGRRVAEILSSENRQGAGEKTGSAKMYLSGGWPPEPQYEFFAGFFGIEAAGLL
ncbi:MAG: glutamate racemase [Spirochaetales bacterium]|jgi:glutamate racemase|nr:glutamate racemase [Spirochaetales bacterium]